ncbi:MAG TPA: UDP-N-acetylglucosamine--N-acetylmuramyl-(pentapeptide) pyrophosphoryl-undecaprenol N-acetylglucosamine transferase [Kiritimatiellia bacterium]|jgi:UDP-N-acetylglucosamine--N-acetylmuramyl-(pentapeptide) pyrophosphoryl-undecaprenol N-acetylglucosamine transferase|nr:UDP-N-acetylglucosamine--N-acetylmuramyl-(pentapeptide) pyrophosphoryl-undecaprenol N-acetylglucosamine transferase [Kiritimatiellia bacterium]
MKPKTFVVACGGTGGHVFPGLAVAQELRLRGHAVDVWFSGRAVERSTLCDWDGPVFLTGARQLSVRTLPQTLNAFFRCARELKRRRPDALLAMGSYTSLPPVVAARLANVPILLHEANAVPGKAVEVLSGMAELTAISFEETAAWMPRRKTVFTGLPVRQELIGKPRFDEIPEGMFTVLVTGGSQGARRVNRLVTQAFCLLQQSGSGEFAVLHQSGAADEARVRQTYEEAGVWARVRAFEPEMGRAYASADLVVCRAGASTCFELCLLGKPALMIPLPSAIRNHQFLNASALARSGGVDVGIEKELSARSIMRYVQNKMRTPACLMHMGEALKALAHPAAAQRVADALESLSEA